MTENAGHLLGAAIVLGGIATGAILVRWYLALPTIVHRRESEQVATTTRPLANNAPSAASTKSQRTLKNV